MAKRKKDELNVENDSKKDAPENEGVPVVSDDEKKVDDKKPSKHELKMEKIKETREKEKQLFQNVFSESKLKDIVSDCYSEMDYYIGMAARGISTGCFIEGLGGIGKTHRTLSLLQRIPRLNFSYLSSFTTPQAFFVWVYQNRDADVLVVDDVVGMLNNDKVLSMLKGMLWAVAGGKRVVNYQTTKAMETEQGEVVPNSYEVTSRIVLLCNRLSKKKPDMEAVLSRVDYCRVEIPKKEMLRLMRQVAEKDYPDIALDERLEVLEFIMENTKDSVANLNLRTLIKGFQYFIYTRWIDNPLMWKTILLKRLRQDDLLILVELLLDSDEFKTEEDRVSQFEVLTDGKSRATYFRLKAKILERRKQEEPEEPIEA